MRTSFHHQSEAQPPNGPLTAATSPDTPSTCPATQSVSRHRRSLGRSPKAGLALGRVDPVEIVAVRLRSGRLDKARQVRWRTRPVILF
jgi:hypothetical protein